MAGSASLEVWGTLGISIDNIAGVFDWFVEWGALKMTEPFALEAVRLSVVADTGSSGRCRAGSPSWNRPLSVQAQ